MRSGKLFKMVDGIPTPVDDDPITVDQLKALIPAALALPYEPATAPDGTILASELVFQNRDGSWMSKAEVASIRDAQSWAAGNWEAGKEIKDRMLGKPKQSVEQLTVTATLENFLARVAENERHYLQAHPPRQVIVDCEASIEIPQDIDIDSII